MWTITHEGVEYTNWPPVISLPIFYPDFEKFPWTIASPHCTKTMLFGYDNWCESYPLEEEIYLVKKCIKQAKNGEKIHFRNLTSFASFELIKKYYQENNCEDTYGHFHVKNTLLTTSITLWHFLWCDKDKAFLQKRMKKDPAYFQDLPPMRTSKDLRIIQQCVRSWLISCIELHLEDIEFLSTCLEKELVPVFQLWQCLYYNWIQAWFTSTQMNTQSVEIHFPVTV